MGQYQFLPPDATQSAVMRLHVVRPSVCLSVTFRYRDHIFWNSSHSGINNWQCMSLTIAAFRDGPDLHAEQPLAGTPSWVSMPFGVAPEDSAVNYYMWNSFSQWAWCMIAIQESIHTMSNGFYHNFTSLWLSKVTQIGMKPLIYSRRNLLYQLEILCRTNHQHGGTDNTAHHFTSKFHINIKAVFDVKNLKPVSVSGFAASAILSNAQIRHASVSMVIAFRKRAMQD